MPLDGAVGVGNERGALAPVAPLQSAKCHLHRPASCRPAGASPFAQPTGGEWPCLLPPQGCGRWPCWRIAHRASKRSRSAWLRARGSATSTTRVLGTSGMARRAWCRAIAGRRRGCPDQTGAVHDGAFSLRSRPRAVRRGRGSVDSTPCIDALQDFQRLGYFGGHHLVDHPALVLLRHQHLDAVPQVAHKRKVRPPLASKPKSA
jgi:hypothetical protein